MKKILLFLLCFPLLINAQTTKKVLLIGIDGCRPDALELANTPTLDNLIANGIYSPDALNDDITIEMKHLSYLNAQSEMLKDSNHSEVNLMRATTIQCIAAVHTENERIEFKNETPFRFLKVEAENYGNCPEWHLGSGGKTWLFFDEITVN